MTPQAHFTVAAPVAEGREQALCDLLDTMNASPGVVNPLNALVPFARFEQLHFARLFVLDDPTLDDLTAYGEPRPVLPKYLVFLGDCDGPGDEFLVDLTGRAGNGLRQIFAHCEGFGPQTDLLEWMRANDRPVAAAYVNWLGRTVTQVREEDALHHALTTQLARDRQRSASMDPQALRRSLAEFMRDEIAAGRLALTAPARTPLMWSVRNCVHTIAVPLVGLIALPLLLLALPLLIYQLRRRETTDAERTALPPEEHVLALQRLDDHDVTNQFSAVGSIKPGLFRRAVVIVALLGLDYACRHIYHRGHLTRVQTIHFARWAFLDGKRRLVFASNYDGSLEGYMDDFINKVGWGLNLVFSNGAGYPRTDWLLMKGSRNEQRFKGFLRRHQLATQVWYKAYPGLTAVDLARNSRIRQGLERVAMSNAEALDWARSL